jgi:3-dehydroquinate dehydratase type I
MNNLKFGLKLGEQPLIAGALTDADVPSIKEERVKSADLIELRVDMFQDISLSHVKEIFKIARERFGKPIIATVRDMKEGGQREIADRLSLYDEIVPLSDMADVEIISGDIFGDIKRLCIANKKTLIGSHHNFEKTPDDDFLDGIVSKGKALGADIVKIATTARSRDDLIRMLNFTLRHKDKGMITMSMGDHGLPSRVVGPVFGSLITYGYINQPSAPGQISTDELLSVFRLLKLR